MTLQKNLKNLCNELSMVMPPADTRGEYSLQFDSLFAVRFIKDKSSIVLLTEGFQFSSEEDYWQSIENVMHQSYGWHGLSSCLAFDEEDRLQIQTRIEEDASYEDFFKMTNYHCVFCELLTSELQKPQSFNLTNFEYHALIAP